jgi:hypothetical protein
MLHRPPGFISATKVKQELDRQRPSAARRGYGRRWRKARAAFLAAHPLCAACWMQGRVVAATVVDHVMPHKGDARLFWDETNWAPHRASPATMPRLHARAAGADLSGTPGGGHLFRRRPPGTGPSPVYAREIQEGGIRPFFGGTAEFPSVEAR